MTNIDAVMQRFCRAGAQAVERYIEVSGEWFMPEYVMPAFILDRLDDGITVTLEVGFTELRKWNDDARKRRPAAQQAQSDNLPIPDRRYLDGWRPDMALFGGDEVQKPKDQQDFLALVEFKRDGIDAERTPGKVSDRDKLLMMLAHIDTCPWGIACGRVREDHRKWQQDVSMKGTHDRWHDHPITLPERFGGPFFFGARLFERSSDNDRLQQLIAMMPALGTIEK